MQRRKNAGFTLIELMIVVAIIAIIASVAIPKLMSARLAANESAAIATLRSLSSAQAQVQSSGAIDGDGDGGGEYGYFGELSGSDPMRIWTVGAGGAIGAVGVDELTPAVMSAAFGNVVASTVQRSGYVFQVWLPGAANAGVAEAAAGGSPGAPDAAGGPVSDNCEVMWCAFAWPIQASNSGNRVFFINQEGDLLQTANRTGAYTAAAGPTPTLGIFSVANNLASALGINGVAAIDGNTWTVVQ